MVSSAPDQHTASLVHPLPYTLWKEVMSFTVSMTGDLEHDHGEGDADGAVRHREHLPGLRGRCGVTVSWGASTSQTLSPTVSST